MAETDLVKDLLKRFGKLVTQRQTWESHWQEVSDYMMPRKADVTKRKITFLDEEETEIDDLLLKFREYVMSKDLELTVLGNPTSVKTLDKYIARKPKAGEMFSVIAQGAPAAIKAVIKYNDLLTFAEAKQPEYREKKGVGYIEFGDKNDYPNYLLSLYNKSAKHNAIVKGKVNYITGNGWAAKEDDVKAEEFINNANPYESLIDVRVG